jgi:hypothetical protein
MKPETPAESVDSVEKQGISGDFRLSVAPMMEGSDSH